LPECLQKCQGTYEAKSLLINNLKKCDETVVVKWGEKAKN